VVRKFAPESATPRDELQFEALAKEDEPECAKDQNGEARADAKKREHGRAGLGLPRFPRRLDDVTVFFRCHASPLPAIGLDRALEVQRQR
jgi:hypothetical protein